MFTEIVDNLYVFNGNNLGNNAYLLINKNHCIVVDPSSYATSIINYINDNNLILDAILLTHAHYDHISSLNDLISHFNVKVYCYKNDEIVVNKYHCSKDIGNIDWKPIPNSFVYFDSNELKLGNFMFEVLYTPGHTSGSVCYRYNNLIFTGDTIFYNSIGRWDLPSADRQQLFDSVKKFTNWARQNDLILPGHDNVYRPYSEVECVNQYIVHFKGVK